MYVIKTFQMSEPKKSFTPVFFLLYPKIKDNWILFLLKLLASKATMVALRAW